MRKLWPVPLLLAVAAAAAFWPSPATEARTRRATAVETAVPEPVAEARSGWARFAEASVRTLRSEPAPDAEIARLGEDLDPETMFEVARDLQRRMTPERARAAAAILRGAPRRDVGLHALMGRREVRNEVMDFFLNDPDPAVRATAAFLLQEIPQGLPAAVLDQARRNVREAPDVLKIESMELLAALPLSEDDAKLIASATGSPEVRIAAARALAAAKAPAEILRPVLESIASDPSMAPEAREAATDSLRAMR